MGGLMDVPQKPETNEQISGSLRVSIVIPMYNAETTIREAIASLVRQEEAAVSEIIVVDDGSTDRSASIVRELADRHPQVRLIRQEHRGAAQTTNHGIREATGDLVGLLDSDASVHPMWLTNLVQAFEDPEVFAAAGRIEIANPQSFWARLAGYELIYRYSRIRGPLVDHLSTCNILYRREVFSTVGLFDPRFWNGYDVDMSYRIGSIGKRIFFCREAVCYNYWRESGSSYYRQQFRYAHDRAELIGTHGDKISGDDVTGPRMFVQVPMTAALLLLSAFAVLETMLTGALAWLIIPAILLLVLLGERFQEAASVFRITDDSIAFWLPPLHLTRNIVWVAGVGYWLARRVGSPHARPPAPA